MPERKFDEAFIRRLANVLQETGLSEIEIENEGVKVRVARNITVSAQVPMTNLATPSALPQPANGGAASASSATAATSSTDYANHPGAVKSPMVGTAYAASEPGKPAFVKIGDRVTKGQTLLIIEAMKVMNPIAAPQAGTVKAILFQDSTPVEFDQVLIVIE